MSDRLMANTTLQTDKCQAATGNRPHSSHIDNMTAELAAIARWEEDGGAPAFFQNRLTAKTLNSGSAALTAEINLLHCLGTAVIMRWDTLPAKLQRGLFDDATCLDDQTP